MSDLPDERRRRLRELFGDALSDEPLELTAEEFSALTNGEIVTQTAPVIPSSAFPGYEAGVTAAEVAQDLREQADREERGEVDIIDTPHDPDDPEWQRYVVEIQAWRRALIDGKDPGPKPEPPATPSPRDDPRFQAHLRQQAAQHRAEARAIEGRLALDRHRTRTHSPTTSGVGRRTHGTRRRGASQVRRRATSPTRGDPDPGESEGDGEPPSSFTLADFTALTSGLSGSARLFLSFLLARELQDAMWDALAAECWERRQ